MFKTITALCAALFLCLGVAFAQSQPLVSFQGPGTPRALGGGTGNLGFRFSSPAPFTVTELGYYDLKGKSLASAHDVALFDGEGTMLARALVGPDAPLDKDDFRYVTVKPLALQAGTYTLSAYAGNGKGADNMFARNVDGFQIANGYTFVGGVFNGEGGFKMADKLEAANNYFGPNLKVSQGQKLTKVACVGDSITFGSHVTDRDKNSYPAVLQKLLGEKYQVANFGVSGATLLKKGDKPYWTQPEFAKSDDFAPDIVVIMLGTNDSKAKNWAFKDDFSNDYRDLIVHYATLGSHPRVYVMQPPPVYETGRYEISPATVENEVTPLVKEIGGATIDVRTPLSNHPELFDDTVHPNNAGAAVIAQTVFDAIKTVRG